MADERRGSCMVMTMMAAGHGVAFHDGWGVTPGSRSCSVSGGSRDVPEGLQLQGRHGRATKQHEKQGNGSHLDRGRDTFMCGLTRSL